MKKWGTRLGIAMVGLVGLIALFYLVLMITR